MRDEVNQFGAAMLKAQCQAMVEPNEREITVKSIIAHYILRHWPHFAFDFSCQQHTAVCLTLKNVKNLFAVLGSLRLEPSSSPILFSSQLSAFIDFFLLPRLGRVLVPIRFFFCSYTAPRNS